MERSGSSASIVTMALLPGDRKLSRGPGLPCWCWRMAPPAFFTAIILEAEKDEAAKDEEEEEGAIRSKLSLLAVFATAPVPPLLRCCWCCWERSPPPAPTTPTAPPTSPSPSPSPRIFVTRERWDSPDAADEGAPDADADAEPEDEPISSDEVDAAEDAVVVVVAVRGGCRSALDEEMADKAPPVGRRATAFPANDAAAAAAAGAGVFSGNRPAR